jgi:hypothetical protein
MGPVLGIQHEKGTLAVLLDEHGVISVARYVAERRPPERRRPLDVSCAEHDRSDLHYLDSIAPPPPDAVHRVARGSRLALPAAPLAGCSTRPVTGQLVADY